MDWARVTVFVSSTFRDMQAERDHLMTVVFPALEERLAAKRLHLEVVDLRWGVDTAQLEPQARNRHILQVCMGEIERSRPLFIGLLGHRYGWVPPREEVRDALGREVDGHASITALELELTLSEGDFDAHYYLRSPPPSGTMPDSLAADFSDELRGDTGAAAQQAALRRRLETERPERVRHYEVTWTADGVTGLEAFGERVLEDLSSALRPRGNAAQAEAPRSADLQALDAFVAARRRQFVGRAELLDALRSAPDQSITVLEGAAGTGKSAVFASLVASAEQPGALLLTAACGCSPGTDRLDRTLRRWLNECADFLGEAAPDTDALEAAQLEQRLASALERTAGRGRTLVLLDALDQLEQSGRDSAWAWMPSPLPPGLRLIATTRPCVVGAALLRQPGAQLRRLEPLAMEERAELVRSICARYHRAVAPSVSEALCTAGAEDSAGNPLWLSLATEHLNLIDRHDYLAAAVPGADPGAALNAFLAELAAGLPRGVTPLFEHLFQRLERTFGAADASWLMGLLSCSRFGWRELDLRRMCELHGVAWSSLRFAVLRRSLRAQLVERVDVGRWDFLHAEARRAAEARYLGASTGGALHDTVLRHLDTLPSDDPLRGELMHHALACGAWTQAAQLLATVAPASTRHQWLQTLARHLMSTPGDLPAFFSAVGFDGARLDPLLDEVAPALVRSGGHARAVVFLQALADHLASAPGLDDDEAAATRLASLGASLGTLLMEQGALRRAYAALDPARWFFVCLKGEARRKHRAQVIRTMLATACCKGEGAGFIYFVSFIKELLDELELLAAEREEGDREVLELFAAFVTQHARLSLEDVHSTERTSGQTLADLVARQRARAPGDLRWHRLHLLAQLAQARQQTVLGASVELSAMEADAASLLASAPHDPEVIALAAEASLASGTRTLSAGDTKGAQPLLARACALALEAIERDPTRGAFQFLAAEAGRAFGRALWLGGRVGAARRVLRRASVLGDALVARVPESRLYQALAADLREERGLAAWRGARAAAAAALRGSPDAAATATALEADAREDLRAALVERLLLTRRLGHGPAVLAQWMSFKDTADLPALARLRGWRAPGAAAGLAVIHFSLVLEDAHVVDRLSLSRTLCRLGLLCGEHGLDVDARRFLEAANRQLAEARFSSAAGDFADHPAVLMTRAACALSSVWWEGSRGQRFDASSGAVALIFDTLRPRGVAPAYAHSEHAAAWASLRAVGFHMLARLLDGRGSLVLDGMRLDTEQAMKVSLQSARDFRALSGQLSLDPSQAERYRALVCGQFEPDEGLKTLDVWVTQVYLLDWLSDDLERPPAWGPDADLAWSAVVESDWGVLLAQSRDRASDTSSRLSELFGLGEVVLKDDAPTQPGGERWLRLLQQAARLDPDAAGWRRGAVGPLLLAAEEALAEGSAAAAGGLVDQARGLLNEGDGDPIATAALLDRVERLAVTVAVATRDQPGERRAREAAIAARLDACIGGPAPSGTPAAAIEQPDVARLLVQRLKDDRAHALREASTPVVALMQEENPGWDELASVEMAERVLSNSPLGPDQDVAQWATQLYAELERRWIPLYAMLHTDEAGWGLGTFRGLQSVLSDLQPPSATRVPAARVPTPAPQGADEDDDKDRARSQSNRLVITLGYAVVVAIGALVLWLWNRAWH
jgi:hypothetical protein